MVEVVGHGRETQLQVGEKILIFVQFESVCKSSRLKAHFVPNESDLIALKKALNSYSPAQRFNPFMAKSAESAR